MTKTYTINSTNGFIGFITIYNNGSFIQGAVYLYETVQIYNGNTMMYQQGGKQNTYNLSIIDIDIIRDLMTTAIPSLRSNGLTYTAIDNGGIVQTV